MEIKLIEAISLISLAESFQNKKLPIKVAFKLNKLLKSIEDHFNFYRDQINNIILEYGQLNEDGSPKLADDGVNYLIREGQQLNFQEKINELSNLIVEIPDDIKFTLDELDQITINVQDMYLFSRFIEE